MDGKDDEISMMGQTGSTLLTTLLTSFINNQRNGLTYQILGTFVQFEVVRT